MPLDVWLELRPGIDPKTLQGFKLCKRSELSVFVRSRIIMEFFFFFHEKQKGKSWTQMLQFKKACEMSGTTDTLQRNTDEHKAALSIISISLNGNKGERVFFSSLNSAEPHQRAATRQLDKNRTNQVIPAHSCFGIFLSFSLTSSGFITLPTSSR